MSNPAFPPLPLSEPETITVHLGEEGRYQLWRIRQLLFDRDPTGTILSAGAALRISLRVHLIQLLGQRADFRLSSCPYRDEYYRLVDVELETRRVHYRDAAASPEPDQKSAFLGRKQPGGRE